MHKHKSVLIFKSTDEYFHIYAKLEFSMLLPVKLSAEKWLNIQFWQQSWAWGEVQILILKKLITSLVNLDIIKFLKKEFDCSFAMETLQQPEPKLEAAGEGWWDILLKHSLWPSHACLGIHHLSRYEPEISINASWVQVKPARNMSRTHFTAKSRKHYLYFSLLKSFMSFRSVG